MLQGKAGFRQPVTMDNAAFADLELTVEQLPRPRAVLPADRQNGNAVQWNPARGGAR
jgi:hypothetical protein